MKISIITINYNNVQGLKRTMESVENQTCKVFEYIIVDGASTDGSVEIVQQVKQTAFQQFQLISESDTGIYNAMNKGIKRSSGDFLLFLNSGDVLFDNSVIENCVKRLDDKCDLISGKLTLINRNEEIVLNPPKELNLYQSIYNHLTHPNTFIKRSLFDRYGLYNEENKIVSDWEFFFLASGLNNCKYQPLDINISKFYEDGVSSSNMELQESEKKKIMDFFLIPAVINELEERNALEKKLNDKGVILIGKLKNKPFFYKIILFILRILTRLF